MAEALARRIAPEGMEIASAGYNPSGEINPLAIEVMREIGLDISGAKSASFSEFKAEELDVVITLCADASDECALALPGHPTQVDWRIDDPVAGELATFRKIRDQVAGLVENLFERGYLKALTWANKKANLILNSLSEGIIVHDINRRISYFNEAAEKITGYAREEVIGRDCHEVFPGNFCGAKCAFCADCPEFEQVKYSLDFVTKSGEARNIEMSVQAVKGDGGKMMGVLASFRDLTRVDEMERRLGQIESFSGIIGRDKKMLEVYDLIRSVADVNVPVLVQGASGTGKELVAAAIHNESLRADKLFVPINCGALPENLLESELFGHVRGAFTGAIRDKKGRFELADGGTIFLDEIGDISPAMQVKLLRVLQEGTFERVGGTKTIQTDVRVISATNKDIREEIASGRFREDLFYRLCVMPIELPPLRERATDIPLLARHFLKRFGAENGRGEITLSAEAMDAFMNYPWPGNIRELQNAIQFALVKCRGGALELAHIPPQIAAAKNIYPERRSEETSPVANAQPAPQPGRKVVREDVLSALGRTDGNKAKAARLLGVNRATLYRYLKKFGIAEDE
jgi:PAS domain S-box-containing protein